MEENRAPALDRALQRDILMKLEQRFPAEAMASEIGFDRADRAWVRNVLYLAEHGLVRADRSRVIAAPMVDHATITAAGLDFISDDGGLSAVLGVVTVKLDAGTLRAIIEHKIEESDLSVEEKGGLMQWAKQAGADALKEATVRLVGAALDRVPDALQLLRMPFG